MSEHARQLCCTCSDHPAGDPIQTGCFPGVNLAEQPVHFILSDNQVTGHDGVGGDVGLFWGIGVDGLKLGIEMIWLIWQEG